MIEKTYFKWPDGYCLDPNGEMSVPAGKDEDFNFGYEIGFRDAWDILNNALRARDEPRFRAMKPKPMETPNAQDNQPPAHKARHNSKGKEMRTLNEHQVNPANDTLKINVVDEPGAGGANHRYEVTGPPRHETNKE